MTWKCLLWNTDSTNSFVFSVTIDNCMAIIIAKQYLRRNETREHSSHRWRSDKFRAPITWFLREVLETPRMCPMSKFQGYSSGKSKLYRVSMANQHIEAQDGVQVSRRPFVCKCRTYNGTWRVTDKRVTSGAAFYDVTNYHPLNSSISPNTNRLQVRFHC